MVSCFSVERRVIFPLRNVKCKDYVSCQVVETRHLRHGSHLANFWKNLFTSR